MNIYIGNLPESTNEEAVRRLFAAYGTVDRVNLIQDRDSGQLRGFGFVEMSSESEAAEAIDLINGVELDGRTLTVKTAKPRSTQSAAVSRSSYGNRYAGNFSDRNVIK